MWLLISAYMWGKTTSLSSEPTRWSCDNCQRMSDFDSCQSNRTHTDGLQKWKASQVVQDLLWHLTSVCVRVGVRYVITKFSRIDSLPNFVTHGAALESSAIINNQVEVMREADISVIALPCRGTMRWRKHCFLKTESYHRHARFLDSWLK